MFPCEQVDGLWDTKSEGVGLIVRAISFLDFQPTLQTDGRTDDIQSQYRALYYSASRGKKYNKETS